MASKQPHGQRRPCSKNGLSSSLQAPPAQYWTELSDSGTGRESNGRESLGSASDPSRDEFVVGAEYVRYRGPREFLGDFDGDLGHASESHVRPPRTSHSARAALRTRSAPIQPLWPLVSGSGPPPIAKHVDVCLQDERLLWMGGIQHREAEPRRRDGSKLLTHVGISTDNQHPMTGAEVSDKDVGPDSSTGRECHREWRNDVEPKLPCNSLPETRKSGSLQVGHGVVLIGT